MREINEILKNNIKGVRYNKVGKCIIVDTKEEKFVIKNNKSDIYNYLNYRSFDNYPELIIDNGYEIMNYIDEIEIPEEQKIIDLINVVADLHIKTTYYKKISEFNIKEIYDDIVNKIKDVGLYYDNLMNNIETTIYFSPSQYLLVRNISNIYNCLNYCIHKIDTWYNQVKESQKIRVAIIHNNLSLKHFINNKLISWDYSKIGLPIFDLCKLYKNTYNIYDWYELLKIYNSKYPLKEEELLLFKILISIPLKIEFTSIEIDNVKLVQERLNYINTTYYLITKKDETLNT